MTSPAPTIARVIDIENDVDGLSVILLCGAAQYKVAWSDAAPVLGATYDVTMSPSVKINRLLGMPDSGTLDHGGDAMRWRKADKHGITRMDTLQKRHLIKRAVRDYLHDEGFIEIDTPLLVKGTTPDAEIDSFAVGDHYLITSAEYQIKRMEIGGFDRLYTLTQNFRLGDRGRYRNPEFTMLEWARVGQSLRAIEEDVEHFTRAAYKTLGGTGKLDYQSHTIDLDGTWERLSVKDAIKRYVGADISDFSTASLRQAVRTAKMHLNDTWANDPVHLVTLLLDHVQGFLGFERPVFLTEWPNFLTSSAEEHAHGGFTERSELFIAGVELSDGFPSLTNTPRQHENFALQQERRRHEGKDTVALDERYLDAMQEGFPSGAGMALGFDRLVMILTNQPDIAAVLAYSWDEL